MVHGLVYKDFVKGSGLLNVTLQNLMLYLCMCFSMCNMRSVLNYPLPVRMVKNHSTLKKVKQLAAPTSKLECQQGM